MTLKFEFSSKIIKKVFLALIATSLINLSHEAEKNSDISYLIESGYRDPTHRLAKHIVALRYGDDMGHFGINHYCGGTILSKNVILTAAHCSMGSAKREIPEKILVVAGTTHRFKKTEFTQIRQVRKILLFPRFNPKLRKGDLALLFLSEPLVEDGVHIQRISLTTSRPQPGQECTTLGWGAIFPHGPRPDELLYVNITILSPKYCTANNVLANGVICADAANGKTNGAGDSGGPFICDGQLSGVVSYGMPEFLLGFYADVWFYRDWILENNSILLSKSSYWIWLLNFVLIALIN